MNETKVRALELAVQFFCSAPKETIDNVIKGRQREGKIVHLPDLILEAAEKFRGYIS